MTNFSVHEQLLKDSHIVGDADLCRVLISKDARYPWLILVPRIEELRDLHDLPVEHGSQLLSEIRQASEWVQSVIQADKVNVAALGNQVPQLHVHVIGRLTKDEAWPGPVWGVGESRPYDAEVLMERTDGITEKMKLQPLG